MSIALPGSAGYESADLQPGPAGSVWAVGRHLVWHLASNGRVLQTVPLPAAQMSQVTQTATATPDGGVSFIAETEQRAVYLDHVSASGAVTTLALGPASAVESPVAGKPPSGPFAVGPGGGLWFVSWSAGQHHAPAGEMSSLDPLTGGVTRYPTPLTPFTINNAPGAHFWIAGVATGPPQRYAVSLVTASGVNLKTITLPGRVRGENLIESASAPGGALWTAVTGRVAYVSASGKLTSVRMPHGTCELPYGLTVGPGGTAWVIGFVEPACGHGVRRYQQQLIRITPSGRLAAATVKFPPTYATGPSLLAFAGGKVWATGARPSGRGDVIFLLAPR
jgi:hypothetical protein